MPDIPLLHNAIASKILKDFKKQLISKDYVNAQKRIPRQSRASFLSLKRAEGRK